MDLGLLLLKLGHPLLEHDDLLVGGLRGLVVVGQHLLLQLGLDQFVLAKLLVGPDFVEGLRLVGLDQLYLLAVVLPANERLQLQLFGSAVLAQLFGREHNVLADVADLG